MAKVQKLAEGSFTLKYSLEAGKGLIYMETEFRNWQRAHLHGNRVKKLAIKRFQKLAEGSFTWK